jgi:uncharacterized protein (DUF488 family)
MHMRGGNPQLISGSPIWPSNVLDRLRKVRISEKHVSRVEKCQEEKEDVRCYRKIFPQRLKQDQNSAHVTTVTPPFRPISSSYR